MAAATSLIAIHIIYCKIIP